MSVSNANTAMDNAKYHKGLPGDTPKGSQKKFMLQDACRRRSIPLDTMDVKSVLWQNVSKHIAENVPPVVVTTPPHHSDLQPIELWAIIKGEIGRQYDISTTPADVLRRMEAAFINVTGPQI
jgi:transposase